MIKIKGVIGWDVVGTQFADMMQRLTGDVDIEIDSPGGYVTDGLSIFNAIKTYKKGKVNIKVVGQASSMAAYIMLAGSSLKFLPNAIVVLHNPWNLAIGDYKVMQKNAELLEKLAALYAEQFIEKGIFTEAEIRSIMDEETWFVGKKELAKLGEIEDFADGSSGDAQDRDVAVALAKDRISQCVAKMRERECDMQALDCIAALMPAKAQTASALPQQMQTQNNVEIKPKGEKQMKNAEELKAQFPNVYAEVFNAGKAAGQADEKERVTTLIGFIDENKDIIVAAINDGSDVTSQKVQAGLLRSRLNASTISAMEKSNPGDVDPQEPEHEPEAQAAAGQPKPLTAEEKAKAEQEQLDQVLAKMGISAE